MSNGTMIRISTATHQRLKEMKADKIKAGDTANYSFDDLINELLNTSDYDV